MAKLIKVKGKTEYATKLGDAPSDVAEASIVVGGKTDKFIPSINASKWSGKAWLDIKHDQPVTTEREAFSSGTVGLTVGSLSHRYYVDRDDHLEYEIEFATRHVSNKVDFSLDFPDGLRFCYQKGPTAQQVARFHAACPDNVVGSYAVYWKESDNQYKTGKFCHIYRPKLIDAAKNETWAILSIDAKAKKLIIEMDSHWLDSAVYPIILGPNLGYSTQGSLTAYWAELSQGNHDTTGISGGHTVKLHLYVDNSGEAATNLKMALYTDDAGNDRPQAQLAAEITIAVGAGFDGEVNGAYAVILAANTKYWVAFNPDDGTPFYYDEDVANRNHYYTPGSWDLEDPWPDAGTNSDWRISMWADYMLMQVNIADAWKNVDSVQINIGDVWKDVSEVQINIGDAWKTVF